MAESHMTSDQPTRKRPRPTVSCLECRRKKLKCDRLLPCQQCVKGKRSEKCAYAEGQEPELRKVALAGVTDDNDDQGCNASTPWTEAGHNNSPNVHIETLMKRIEELEQVVQQQQSATNIASLHTAFQLQGDLGTNQRILGGSSSDQQDLTYPPLFDQVRQGIDAALDPQDGAEMMKLCQLGQSLRAIADCLDKPVRHPKTTYSNLREIVQCMISMLPPHDTCQKLIHLYFENFEHCLRILHKPTVMRNFQRCVEGKVSERDSYNFMPILVSIVSIASSLNTIPECNVPMLHGGSGEPGAVQLVENWIEVAETTGIEIDSIITVKILSMQAQRSKCKNVKQLWIESGQLIRQAIVSNYNKEPPSSFSALEVELRRRTWLTVLEQDLALSIAANMPLNTISYDLPPPINADDEQLDGTVDGTHVSRPSGEWTGGLCQHILAQSLNLRMEAYKLSHGPTLSSKYNKVLEYARHLEQTLCQLPASFKLDQNNSPGRLLAQMELDITLRRPLIALYAPFAALMPGDDRFCEARIAWVQSNLVILCFQDLFDTKFPAIDVPQPEGYWDFYYNVYEFDVRQGLRAELLELQRMKTYAFESSESRGLGLPQHAGRPSTRILGWTAKGMTESVEDTLDPLIRRVGRPGSNLAVIIQSTIWSESLKAYGSSEASKCVRAELNNLIELIKSRIGRNWSGMTPQDVQNGLTGQQPPPSVADLKWLRDFVASGDST